MQQRLGILELCVAVLMATLVIVVSAQVAVRYLTYHPLDWTEEVARYVFVWLCLLGAVVAARRGQHFAVDFAQRLLPQAAQRGLIAITKSAEALFYLLLAWAGVQMLATVHAQELPSLEIPMSIPYLAIPAGAALMGLISIRQAWTAWRRQD